MAKPKLAWFEKGLDPVVSVVAVIMFLAVVTTISLIVFWDSEARDNVVLIQQVTEGNLDAELPADLFNDDVNDDGVLTTAELLHIRRNIQTQADKLNPDADFGGSELDEDRLGF